MFRIHRLSSEPECFDPVNFHSGVNLILGERTEKDPQGRKVNGVGKSVCIEFLHFSLCRVFTETRVSKIPEDALPSNLVVILDLTVGKERLQIRRSIANPNQPTIIKSDGSEIVFEKLDDATDYLGSLLFENHVNSGQLSFRRLMSLLMRDERSGFKSYINPYDIVRRSPDDIAPHLYLMGIELNTYQRLMDTIERLDRQSKLLKELKHAVTNGNEIKIQDVPTKLNEERQATRKIEEALSTLRADPAFEEVETELIQIENDLQRLRAERKSLSFQIDQIRSIPLPERIDATDLKIVFDRVKSGLGELVEKSLDQAKQFKSEIERFQQALRQEELQELETRRRIVSAEIKALSDKHADLTRQTDRQGVLSELTNGLEVATRRSDEYHRLNSQYKLYLDKLKEVENIKNDRSNDLHALTEVLDANNEVQQSFNDTVVAIHERIMQSSRASFRVELSGKVTSKRPLTFDLRIQDDGSNSIDRDRVFIYDFALMFDPICRENHPGFLVHDNILEVDQDTLTQCLNFVHEQMEAGNDFQYILTLNREGIVGEEKNRGIKLDINAAKCASFTKSSQFLKKRYQER